MAGPISKTSVLLAGGIDEHSGSELSSPVAPTGTPITLRRSENTRLTSSRGTCVRAPEAEGTGFSDGLVPIYTAISSEAGKSSLVIRRGDNLRTGESGEYSPTNPVASPLESSPLANHFITATIDESGASPGLAYERREVSTLVQSDAGPRVYHAFLHHDWDQPSSSAFSIMVYVTDVDGALIITPEAVATSTTLAVDFTLGITSHNDGQVNVWWDGGTFLRTVSVTGVEASNTFTVGTPTDVAIANPIEAFAIVGGAYITHDGTAVNTYRRYAYVITGTGSTATLRRIDVQAGYALVAVAGVTVTGVSSDKITLAFALTSGGERLVAVYRDLNLLTVNTYLPDLTVDTATSTAVPDFSIGLAAHFWNDQVVVLTAGVETSGDISTRIYTSVLGILAHRDGQPLPWMVPVSQGGQIRFSATESAPVFELARYYGADGATIEDPDFVPDPDVQMWGLFGSEDAVLTPLARYGCVRGAAAPARSPLPFTQGRSGPIFIGNDSVWTSYPLRDDALSDGHMRGRWLVVNAGANHPPRAHDRDGTTLVAAPLPIEWDGVLPSELGGPMYIPHLSNTLVAGAGVAGDYAVAAIYTWRDGAGKRHRSSPGFTTFTLSGADAAEIFITAPCSLLHGVPDPENLTLELYATTPTDVSFRRYLVQWGGVDGDITAYGWTVNQFEGGPGNYYEQIYSGGSAGEEQTPQPPPPLRDITIIGDRAVGIDAEMPSRLVYSKRRVAGIGYEWHPGYEVLLPSGAGEAVAVREWQGAFVVFAERAIFVVSGDGPDNLVGNPSGGGFSKPQKLVDIGCTNGASVVSTPAGIVFQRDEGMMLFAGGAPVFMGGPLLESDCVGGVVLHDADELVLFFPERQCVWNYEVKRWTTWELQSSDASVPLAATGVSSLAHTPHKAQIVGFEGAVPRLYVLDSLTHSTLPMLWETDWLLLQGDFQDHVFFQHLVFSAKREGTHGLQVDIFTNYDDVTPTTTRSYTDAELTTLSSGPNRYTVKVQATNRGTRAVKIRLSETAPIGAGGMGMKPIALTLYSNLEAILMEPAIRPGALK